MRWLPFLLLVACAPSGQLLLYVDTDATVPPAAGAAPDPTRPPWLFDRLRVDVIAEGAIAATRDFVVDERAFREHRVSLGIAPPIDDASLSARVRLFRGDRVVDGEPPASSTLDSTIALPPIGRSGTVERTVVLHTADVGTPIVAESSEGPPSASLIGSFTGAARTPCHGTAAPDEVCVPGGAYWLGESGVRFGLDGAKPTSEHLVVLSPFFLDRSEVTVGAFRQKWATLGGKYKPGQRDLSQDPRSLKTWCTWTDAPAGLEALPINCVLEQTAELYCEARGRVLPTEAQLEYVSSGLGAERPFVWGGDEPACADAVWGLGGGGGIDSANPGAGDCLPSASLGSVAPPGRGLRDRLAFSEGEVVDLAGNVAELTRDAYRDLDEGIWATPGVLQDPRQPIESDAEATVARGGDFHNGVLALRASYRQGVPSAVSPGVGFRCARPDTP